MTEPNALAIIRDEVSACYKCKNSFSDVFFTHRLGTISRKSQDVFVVGERPGQAAGEKLEVSEEEYEERISRNAYGQFIEDLGLGFERAYFSNIVKCAAKDQREAAAAEIENCKGFLVRQIELKRPKVIIACGKPTIKGLTGKDVKVGTEAGRIMSWQSIPLIVSPNPAGTYFKVNRVKLLSAVKQALSSALRA